MQSGRPGGREEADLTLGQSAAIITESILAGRNQRTALADSYMALETVLEQMEKQDLCLRYDRKEHAVCQSFPAAGFFAESWQRILLAG